MWTRLLLLLLGGLALGSLNAAELQIRITGVGDEGMPTVAWYLYDEAGRSGFPLKREQAHRSGAVEAVNGGASVTLSALPPGRYALFVFHDANKNGVIDHKFYGPPAEALGYYRHFTPRFSPPDFNQVAFTLMDELSAVQIRLQPF